MSDKPEKFIRQENNPGAVLNTDQNALLAYKRQKAKAQSVERLQSDVADLRAQVSYNNVILTQILEKLSKQL